MSEEATRAVVSRWFDSLDAGDVDTAMACLDDNVRWINSPAKEGKPGGGIRPFGYAKDHVTVVPEEAELIREAATPRAFGRGRQDRRR